MAKSLKIIKPRKNKSVLLVIWQDAAFSNFKNLPQEMPPLQITFGIFLGETKKALNIGMNCHLDSKTRKFTDCKDAFLIPKSVVKKIKIISTVNV